MKAGDSAANSTSFINLQCGKVEDYYDSAQSRSTSKKKIILTWGIRDCLRMAAIWWWCPIGPLPVLWTDTWLEIGLEQGPPSATVPPPLPTPTPLLLHREDVEPRLSEARLGVASCCCCCCWRCCREDMMASTTDAKASTSFVLGECRDPLGVTEAPASPVVAPARAKTDSASSSRRLGSSVAVERAVNNSRRVDISPRRLVSVSYEDGEKCEPLEVYYNTWTVV